ncbi:MAG: RNA polymerase sigma factor [Rhizobacter sp.]
MQSVSRLSGWLENAATRMRSGAPTRADDWALWREACAGNPRSAQRLVRELTPPAYGLALQLLRRKEDAEDVVQEAFLRLWRSNPSDTHGAKLSTYFNTIVINRCRSLLTTRRDEATDPDVLADLHDARQASDGTDRDADHPTGFAGARVGQDLDRSLGCLPVRQRMAIVMWAYADAGIADIARALDIDPNAAHQLLHRAKHSLRMHLEGSAP